MYIAPGQGQTTPGDKFFMSTETSCHFGHLLQVSNKISLKSNFIHFFFMILYMYIAPGQGLTTPWDEILMSTGTSCHFGDLLQVSTKSLRSLILYNFFHDFIYVYSPGAGQTAPRVQKFYVNRKALPLYSFVASFKEISFKSDLIQFFS